MPGWLHAPAENRHAHEDAAALSTIRTRSRGQARAAGVINAINAVIAAKSQYNIRVMNLSLGRPVFEPVDLDPLCQAVEAAWKAGIVVVVAAGNQGRNNSAGTYGHGTIAAPGNDPSSAMQGFNLIWGSSLGWGSSSEMSAEAVRAEDPASLEAAGHFTTEREDRLGRLPLQRISETGGRVRQWQFRHGHREFPL